MPHLAGRPTTPRGQNNSPLDRPPVMTITRHDRTSSSLLATVLMLISSAVILGTVYVINRPAPPPEIVPLELIDLSGGFEDGLEETTLHVESPEDLQEDAADVEEQSDRFALAETLETVVELSDQASELIAQQEGSAELHEGTPGSAEGTGGRALGEGGGTTGGVPAEKRWYINFADDGSLDTYAKQLDSFGIELGAVFPDGRLVYVSNLSSPRPQTRTATSGKDEDRLYMTWQGGERRAADRQLLQRAGVNAVGATILHFYPERTEQMLARLEADAAKRPIRDIRRTFFDVVSAGNGYTFKVTRQIFFLTSSL